MILWVGVALQQAPPLTPPPYTDHAPSPRVVCCRTVCHCCRRRCRLVWLQSAAPATKEKKSAPNTAAVNVTSSSSVTTLASSTPRGNPNAPPPGVSTHTHPPTGTPPFWPYDSLKKEKKRRYARKTKSLDPN